MKYHTNVISFVELTIIRYFLIANFILHEFCSHQKNNFVWFDTSF